MKKNDLENRLIAFSVQIIELSKNITNNYAGIILTKQLIRSSTSSALNYGEAQSAESKKDFIHKIKLVLKELRESLVNLKILEGAQLHSNLSLILDSRIECNELISIFVKSVQTAQQ